MMTIPPGGAELSDREIARLALLKHYASESYRCTRGLRRRYGLGEQEQMTTGTEPDLAEMLRQLLSLIERESTWDPKFCRDKFGRPVSADDQHAATFTLTAALRKVQPVGGELWLALSEAAERLDFGDMSLEQINTEAGHAAVVDIITEALDTAEGGG